MMPPDDAEERIVQFRSDGLGLSPQAYARLLAQIAETRGIAEDDYSRDGVVAELETRMAGQAFDFAEMRRIAGLAREHDIGLHLDGARLLIEAVYTGIAPADYAMLFDTVYVSLYKYLNAAAGAVLAGPRALLDGLYHQRRMFGGGLPHVWPYAAVALYCLDGFAERFAEAAAASEPLIDALRDHRRVSAERPSNATNVTLLKITGEAAAAFPQRLLECGIAIRP